MQLQQPLGTFLLFCRTGVRNAKQAAGSARSDA
jgi:hypothetical protein